MNETTLGECVQIINGFVFDSELFSTQRSGLPIARIRDVVRGYSETYYQGDFPEAVVIENGDLLVGMDGEFNVGRWNGGQALLNQRVCKVVAKHGRIDQQYVKHLLPRILRRIEDAAPFVTVKHLSSEDLKQVVIALPALAEQKRIASILERADRLRRLRRYGLEMAKGLADMLFLTFFGEDGRWPRKSLEEVVQPERGITYGIVQAGPDVPDGIPYIRTGDIVDGEVMTERLLRTSHEIAGTYKRSEVKFGDLVFSIRATVGTAAMLPKQLDGANLTQGTARIAPGPCIDKRFLLWQLRTREVQEWIKQQVKGSTFLEITLARLRQLPVFVPPLDMQMEFAEMAEKHERSVAIHRESLRQAEHLFQTLLERAFTSGL